MFDQAFPVTDPGNRKCGRTPVLRIEYPSLLQVRVIDVFRRVFKRYSQFRRKLPQEDPLGFFIQPVYLVKCLCGCVVFCHRKSQSLICRFIRKELSIKVRIQIEPGQLAYLAQVPILVKKPGIPGLDLVI